MYVCICNALNERKVNSALEAGADSAGRVYRHHGCAAKCGKCVPLMQDMVDRHLGVAPPCRPVMHPMTADEPAFVPMAAE